MVFGGLTLSAMAVIFAVACSTAVAKSEQDTQASKKLADKLMKLSQSLDMKEARYPESKGGGGKDYDANTGNSFTSNTTYHSYVWDYCENWVGPNNCNKWLDPYVSSHGKDGDRSPLEGVVWEDYQARKQQGAPAQADQYAIWQVRSKGGAIIDQQGRLDRGQLAEFKLLPDVAAKIGKIGSDTATRQINLTFEEGEKEANTMPNMESLRFMASRWTRMFRNRMVANLGELRASDKPIEFGLGEDKADCDQYLAVLRTEMDRFRLEERLDVQARQEFDTRTTRLEQRYALCQKMRQQDVMAVNPTVQGDEIVEAGPNGEQIDKWRTRVQIATMDFVGIDPNALPKPADEEVKKEDYTQAMTEYGVGGLPGGEKYMTNAEQLQGYNEALQDAAQGFKEVSARSGQIRDNSAEVLKYQIKAGTVNMVQLNSLTGEMKSELSDTGFPRTNDGGDRNPETYLERTPAELTVTRR